MSVLSLWQLVYFVCHFHQSFWVGALCWEMSLNVKKWVFLLFGIFLQF